MNANPKIESYKWQQYFNEIYENWLVPQANNFLFRRVDHNGDQGQWGI